MNNALEAYARHAQRVARLLAWLDEASQRHADRAFDFEEPARLWPMVGSLAHVEAELKPILAFLAAVSEDEIEASLGDGGQGDE